MGAVMSTIFHVWSHYKSDARKSKTLTQIQCAVVDRHKNKTLKGNIHIDICVLCITLILKRQAFPQH